MGNQEAWGHPSHVLLNGLLPNEVASATSVLDADRWSIAEVRIADLIHQIQPNLHSEERRIAVANYVQRLIMKCFSCQVFTFGSVPLKTYLPDGDIDMTAFSNNLTLKDTWANEVRNMLENEEKSENAEFRVKEVQYIQAEVKIIKCLVENIVVDISFNQLGGLCTLCFLEEIDQFINQDHLFKRSIILIKAWCYYESRILGAHHGLISTYALEILVLYIFHVFNNSFAGPLEVLYRFLEFFSNFDWDNFCVSLWGPVPISSLPDIAAEPPRKDNGRLLLRKEFLDACSSRYSVFPGGQENQGQPFVSKFFNVIDPLRTNNNLGRSVSKGNFHRIRSAFAFGAKRLAVLLECPKDELVSEVNKFFMNTWRRHGVGHRPDAPSPDLRTTPANRGRHVEESENPRIHLGTKEMSENTGSLVAREHQTDGFPSQGLGASHSVTTVNQSTQNIYGSDSLSTNSHSHNRKIGSNQTGSRIPNQRNIPSSEPIQDDDNHKSLRLNHVSGEHLASRIQFARTRSSPELSHTSVVSNQKQHKMPEKNKNQIAYSRPEQTGRKKSLGSETSGGPSVRSTSNDPLSLKQTSDQTLDVAGDSFCSSNSYEDTGFASTGEEFAMISDVLDMQQEEQDLVNMMASSRLSNFNGQLHLPMNIPSAHVPFSLSPSMLASMGFPQRNLAGILPGNTPLIKPPWGSVVQFSHGLASPQLPNYLHNAGLGSNQEETLESPNESSSMTEMNMEDDPDHGFWQDQGTGSVRVLGPKSGNVQMIHSDDKHVPSMRINSASSSGGNSSSSSFARGQHKLGREDKLGRGDLGDAYQHQVSAGQDTYSSDRIANLRFVANAQASSSSRRPSSGSGSSWDGPSTKASKVGRDKRGRKTTTSVSSPYGETKGGWQYEDSSPDHHSVPGEDENKDWIPLSMMGTDVVERSGGSTSLVSPAHPSGHHLSGYGQAQMNGSDAVVPIAPMLVSSGSRLRTGDGAGVMPITFYPTGPPVPFLTMLPLCNFPAEPGSSDRSSRLDNGHMNPSDKNFDSEDNEQLEGQLSPGSVKCSSFEHPEELKPDILNSDFSSHWQNLQYGRLCQNTRYPGPLVYPSPVVIPPLYLQGHLPWDGPGRPLSTNMNLFTQVAGYGPRVVPVAPLQSGQSRPSTVFQQYGDEIPRYRGGTGTYLPNPKVSYRDRQSPRARGHRGNYNYERHDHIDREGSWINSKSRATGRSHGRSQTEKPSPRSDRLSAIDNRSDRPWDSYRNEPMANYQNQLGSINSTNKHGSVNMAHGMYPLPTVNSNGVNSSGPGVPSVVMLYSYDPSATYAPSSEQLEFGSLGPVQLFGLSEAPQPTDGGPVRVMFEQRQGAYQQVSPHSSPDQPSSPQVHKRAI